MDYIRFKIDREIEGMGRGNRILFSAGSVYEVGPGKTIDPAMAEGFVRRDEAEAVEVEIEETITVRASGQGDATETVSAPVVTQDDVSRPQIFTPPQAVTPAEQRAAAGLDRPAADGGEETTKPKSKSGRKGKTFEADKAGVKTDVKPA
jgi:hypothetical protein